MGDGLSLEALGVHLAPREWPLLYPGVWPAESGVLDGGRLLPFDASDGALLAGRTPVLAVGSNACPGQLRHKMAESGIGSPVPLVRCRVTGLGVGVSAHVSVMGYVSASPFHAPGAVRELFVTWFDARQLAVIDASETAYDRAWVPGPEVRVEPEAGEPLPGAFVYVNRHGVLHDGAGEPREHPGQRPLLTELLAESAGLRDLFGATPEEFVSNARAKRALCEQGTRLFAREGRVTASGLERHVREARPNLAAE
ncbi:hypothetical protein AB0F77_26395 [Streptomyces sp. NPDC026672]|uniref:hypothetical protein n=1 Tax=unclassified Streptomyces TaxID=2593676 RepID=UPI0033D185DC